MLRQITAITRSARSRPATRGPRRLEAGGRLFSARQLGAHVERLRAATLAPRARPTPSAQRCATTRGPAAPGGQDREGTWWLRRKEVDAGDSADAARAGQRRNSSF